MFSNLITSDGIVRGREYILEDSLYFHKHLSSTFQQTDRTKKIRYASGDEVNGPVATDTMSSSTFAQLSVKDFPFIMQATTLPFMGGSSLISGLIGLSPENDVSGPLFVTALHRQGQIPKNQFSVMLTFNLQQESYLTFGGLPEFLANQDLDFVCHRIAGDFHWQLKMLGMKVGDTEIDASAHKLMLTDTGTTLTYLAGSTYD